MDMVYSLLRAWIRWSSFYLPTYFTPKSLTTNEKMFFGGVLPKKGGTSNRVVPKFCEVEPEAVVGNADSLLQPGHAFSDFHKNPAIRGEGAEMILGNDFFGNRVQGHLHILVPLHRGIVVKNDDIQGYELGQGSGHRVVEQALGCCQTSVGGGCDTGEVQFVTANGDAYTMCFSLVGPDTRDEASVRDLAPCRDVAAPHKKTVLVPVGMRVSTPCASLPRSLARLQVQTSLLGPRSKCQYSRDLPVTSSVTELVALAVQAASTANIRQVAVT